MSTVLAFKLAQRTCPKSLFSCNSNINVFFKRIPVQTLASVSAIKGFGEKKQILNVPQNCKFSLTVSKKATPEIEHAGHDHVKHWTAEKVLTVVLLGAIPAAVLIPSPAVEYFLALTLSVHAHWGIEAIVVDYIRPSVFGKVIPKLAVASVYGLSILTLGGLCYFIYSDVGIINAVKLLWKL